MNDPIRPAVENLRQYQRQLDMDGIFVGVSRQALEEVLDYIEADRAAIAAMREHLVPVVFSDSDRAELRKIIHERSFKTGNFTLSSGQQSNLYFNMKPTMMDAHGAGLAARAFIDLLDRTDAEYVSGLEMGAVPVIGAMAAVGGLIGRPVKTTFVRKRLKEHGTKEMIEGLGPNESLKGKRVFVVEDVATSGKSILQAIDEVRNAGGIVTDAAALVNRHEGGNQLMLDHGVILHQVFAAAEIAEGRV